MNKKEYLKAKENALKSLKHAYSQQKVDDRIILILKLINKINGFYTLSSCAGRIVLLEIPQIGDKRQATFLGIWHRTIEQRDILAAKTKANEGLLWLIAQAPILHIGAQTLALANTLVKTAISCGFKNSAIKSTEKKIIIEICSTERLDAPIGRNGNLYCTNDHLALLTEISNEIMIRSSKKLDKFTIKIRKNNNFI